MPAVPSTQWCRSCDDELYEPSVFSGLCRTCVAQKSSEAFDELAATPGALCADAFRVDEEMLGLAGIKKLPPVDEDDEDGEDELDLSDQGPWAFSFHRIHLLWALGAEVDDLRGQLAEAASALVDIGLDRHESIPAALRRVAADLERARLDLEATRGELRCLSEERDSLSDAYRDNHTDLRLTEARAAYLAAITRESLLKQHGTGRHDGPIHLCRHCRADWGVATVNGDD